MKLIPSVLQRNRLFAAMVLLAGLSGTACANAATAPSFLYKDKAAAQPDGEKTTAQNAQIRAAAGHLKLPVYFETNRGQTDASVKFLTRAAGYNMYLTASEAVMVMPKTAGAAVVRMMLKGANASPSVQGLDILPGHTSYLLGKDHSKWQTGVEHYAKVKFGQVYPGIDMVYYGSQGQIEYDFVVAPGADPSRILIGFEGGNSLRLDAKGNLILGMEGGELTYKAPNLYQKLDGKRVPVQGRFVLAGNNQARFEVGNYIKSKELVIDPTLAYSSFLGGTVDDKAYAVAVDAAGNAYLTGSTLSTLFPGTAGNYQATNGGGTDVFVSKISPDGTSVLWSTYYGGAGDDTGLGIGVDGAGKVYVTGSATGALPDESLIGPGGGTDAFTAAFSADGQSLVYADRFGGAGEESGNGIAVDSAGNAYVTGHTTSMAINSFPVTAGAAQTTGGGADDAFVAEFNAVGAQVYATYLGGTGQDQGNAIAIDSLGAAYVTGECEDAFLATASWPNVFKPTITGSKDAFIVKVHPTGSNFSYETYVGGSGIDEGTGIAVDSVNDIYITGYTFSADFPGNGFVPVGQTTIGTAPDAFVFKLKIGLIGGIDDGVYSTYLGASGDDRATAIAVDGSFNAYVTGITYSGDFPMVGPVSGGETLVGAPEAFVTELGPTGASKLFSTYLGGTTMTGGEGIALDSTNRIYVAGWTNSDAATFPLSTPFQAANAGSFDSFITKIYLGVDIDSPTISIVQPPDGSFLNYTSTTVVVNYDDETGGSGLSTGTLVIKLDSVALSTAAFTRYASSATVQLTGLSQSTHTLDASIQDNSSNTANAVQTGFTVDLATPTISIVQPADSSFLSATSTTVVVNYSDAGGSGLSTGTLVIKLDSVALSTGTFTRYASSATVALTGLSQSIHTLDASIEDNAGNLADAVQTGFTVSLSSPTISIAQPANGSFLNYTSTRVVVNYADNSGSGLSTGTLVIKLDSVALSAGTFTRYASSATVQLTGLSQSTHTLDASIEDNASNLTNAVQTAFTVDLATPTISIVQPPDNSVVNSSFTTAVVNYADTGGSGLKLASLAVTIDGDPVSASAWASSATVSLTGLTAGVHTLNASIADNGGNSAAASQISFTVTMSVACRGDFFFPSPATGATGQFEYCMAHAGTAKIRVYNAIGDLVAKLEDTWTVAGAQLSTLNTKRLAPGVYLYRLEKDYGGGNSVKSEVKKFAVKH